MLRARAHLPGPNYVMFNNIYSREDAQRLQQRRAASATTAGADGLPS